MKVLSPDFAAHLDGTTTTLARCYVIRRTDGRTLGFTDHDRPLTVLGIDCEPESGFSSSEAVAEAGFAVGGFEVAGALSSSILTEDDLERGRYDEALVDVYLVNWMSPSEFIHERRARIGDITRRDGLFRAELRSLIADYDVPRGRYIRATCDARFGDARCGKPLGAFRHHGSVHSVIDLREVRVTIPVALASGLLQKGELAFLNGVLAGTVHSVRDHDRVGPLAVLTLAERLPDLPASGTLIHVTQGCDKRYETCRDRFANRANFRGFPHIPGNDFVYSHPTRRGGANTGIVR